MRRIVWLASVALVIGLNVAPRAQSPAPAADPVRTLVSRLELERYKATIKGLTQFGDTVRARSATARRWTGSKRS